jgi:hypothetical protein
MNITDDGSWSYMTLHYPAPLQSQSLPQCGPLPAEPTAHHLEILLPGDCEDWDFDPVNGGNVCLHREDEYDWR